LEFDLKYVVSVILKKYLIVKNVFPFTVGSLTPHWNSFCIDKLFEILIIFNLLAISLALANEFVNLEPRDSINSFRGTMAKFTCMVALCSIVLARFNYYNSTKESGLHKFKSSQLLFIWNFILIYFLFS